MLLLNIITIGLDTNYNNLQRSSGVSELTPVFSGVRVIRSVLFCVMFCRSLLSSGISGQLISISATNDKNNTRLISMTSYLNDRYVVVPAADVHSNVVFVCKYNYRLLDKGIRYCQFPWQPYIYPTPTKMKSWTIINLFSVPLVFQPMMKTEYSDTLLDT
jgi:hypothetical protein